MRINSHKRKKIQLQKQQQQQLQSLSVDVSVSTTDDDQNKYILYYLGNEVDMIGIIIDDRQAHYSLHFHFDLTLDS